VFDCYSEIYQNEKCLMLAQVGKLQNPDVKPHIDRLNWLIDDLQYVSPLGHNVLTLEDLDNVVR